MTRLKMLENKSSVRSVHADAAAPPGGDLKQLYGNSCDWIGSAPRLSWADKLDSSNFAACSDDASPCSSVVVGHSDAPSSAARDIAAMLASPIVRKSLRRSVPPKLSYLKFDFGD